MHLRTGREHSDRMPVHELVNGMTENKIRRKTVQELQQTEIANLYLEIYLLKKKIEGMKWIPVTEILPDPDVDVLIQFKDGSMDVGHLYQRPFERSWVVLCTVLGFGGVVAWMPLPDPYKGDKE